jgi:tetratricopeptide (TPR) repeat protein
MKDDALEQFQRHLGQQNWDAAQQVVQEAIRFDASDWNAIYLLGVVHRYRGDFRGAIEHYKRALQLAGEIPSILQALGIAHQQLRDYPSAFRALTRAAQLQPDNYEIHTSLGITYSMSGDTEAAIREHERAMEICVDRAFAEILRDRDRYFSIKDQGDQRVFSLTPEYFTVMRQILATDLRYFNAVMNMAACFVDIGDHKKAHELMKLADTCTPIEADLIGPIKRSSS